MKASKKVLSLLLATLMIFGLIPTVAFAQDEAVANQEDFVAACQAAESGDTIILGAGTFNLQDISVNSGKSLTFVGAGYESTILQYGQNTAGEGGGCYSFDGAGKITFKNVSFDDRYPSYKTDYSHGFVRANGMEFENCKFTDTIGSWGCGSVTVKNCIFDPDVSAEYCLKTYSGTSFYFEGCTFNGNNKGYFNIYRQHDPETPLSVTVKDCTFNKVGNTSKTPIYFYDVIDNGGTWNISLEGTMTNADNKISVNNVSDSWLWGDMKTGANLTTVTVNGVKVWEKGAKVEVEAHNVVIGEGDDAKDAEVTVQQNSDVVTEGEGIAEEIRTLDNDIKTKIANNTKVTDVNLTTTAEEGKTSGLQAVVDTAIKENTALAEAIKDAETINVEVMVSVVPTQFIAPVAAAQGTPEQVGTVTFELKPTAIVTVGTDDGAKSQKVDVANDMIDRSKPITVNFYTGFEPAKIVHTGDDGFEEVFRKTGDKTFSYNNGICTLQISHFSKLTALSEDYVAQVTIGENTTNYKTLAEAISAANKAGADSWDKAPVIELLDSCEVQATHQPDNYGAVHFYANWGDVKDAYFILNGNNHTIKLTGEDPTTSKKGRFLTLKFSAGTHGRVSDLIVDANQKGHAAIDCVNAEVYLDNVTVKNTDGGWSAFNVVNSTVELKNCTATENVKQVISCDKGTKDVPSIATIKSGTYDGTLRTEGTNEYNKLIIEGGKFSFASVNQNDEKQDMIIDEAAGSIIEISGGIFSIAPTANVLAEDLKVVDNTDEDTKTAYPYTVGPMEPVAKIGEKTYTSLAAATAAAQDNDTITLLADTELTADVTIGKNITLDLAGKTIETNGYCITVDACDVTVTGNGKMNNKVEGSISPETPKTIIYVKNGSNLTIKNGTFTTNAFMAIVTDNAHLTVEDGTFRCTSTNTYDMKSLIKGVNGAVMDILGGTIECYSNYGDYEGMYGIYTRGPGETEVVKNATVLNLGKTGTDGPTIHSYYAPIATNGSYSPVKINVYSGTFIGDCDYSGANEDMNVIQLSAQSANGSEVNIYGGTFTQTATTNKVSHVIEVRYNAKKAVNIYGGLFSSADSVIHKNTGKDEANTAYAITGGYYTSDISSDVANGYVCIANDDVSTKDAYPYIATVAPTKVDVEEKVTEVVTEGDKQDTVSEKVSPELAGEVKKGVVEEIIENASQTSKSDIQEQIPEGTKVEVKDTEDTKEVELNENTKTRIDVKLESVQVDVGTNTETPVIVAECTVTTTTATYDVKPIVTLTTTNEETGETTVKTLVITNDWLKENEKVLTFTLPVPDSMIGDSVLVKHIKDDETAETFNARVETENGKRFITIVAAEFSTYELSQQTEESAAAKIISGGKTYFYSSLANAVSDAQNNDTIILLKDSESDPILVDRAVVFSVNKGSFALNASIEAAEGFEKSVTEDTYTFTEKPEDVCFGTKIVQLTDNLTCGLKLNCKDTEQQFIFTKNGSGWNIKQAGEGGKYLTMQDGKLVLSDAAFAWTYKNGAFSTSVKTTQKTSGHWILFIYIPGSTKTVTTTYYLSTVTAGAGLSTCSVCAELYTTVSGTHDFGCWIDCKDGNHKHICKNCGKVETEECVYDNDTHKCVCGAYDPSCAVMDVTATYATKTTKQFSGFLFWGTWKNVTTYTATVKVNTEGMKVTKVEVSANQNKGWTKSNTFTSNSEIEQFFVCVTTSDGAKHLFRVANGIGYPAN